MASVARAEFVVSAIAARDFPREGLPEVVLAGRSNVGKSSLINKLVGHKNLARTSSTPGKTQSINFYRLDRFFFVDLPGYGYAKVSKGASRKWRHLVDSYFHGRANIALVVHLVDSRIAPTALDLELAEWLRHLGVPALRVATKVDKLSASDRTRRLRELTAALGGEPPIAASAMSGEGCREIWKRVLEATTGTLRE
jgi:GTP-binding protein